MLDSGGYAVSLTEHNHLSTLGSMKNYLLSLFKELRIELYPAQ